MTETTEKTEKIEMPNMASDLVGGDFLSPSQKLPRPPALTSHGHENDYDNDAIIESMKITMGTTPTAIESLVKNGSIPPPPKQNNNSNGNAQVFTPTPDNYEITERSSVTLARHIKEFNIDSSEINGMTTNCEKLLTMVSIACDFMKKYENIISDMRGDIDALQNITHQTQGFMMPVGEPTYYNPKLLKCLEKFNNVYKDGHNFTIMGKLITLVRYTENPSFAKLIDLGVDTNTFKPQLKIIDPHNEANYKTWKFDDDDRKKYETDDIALMTMYTEVFNWLWRPYPDNATGVVS